MVQHIDIQIPINLIDRGENAVLQEIAIQLYQKKIYTFGQSRRLLNISVWEFQNLLGKNHIDRQYDRDDLLEDIQSIQSGVWDDDSNL